MILKTTIGSRAAFFFDPSLCGDLVIPETTVKALPLTVRKVIGRRAIMELLPGAAINPQEPAFQTMLSAQSPQKGLSNDILLTVESGLYGGIPEGGGGFWYCAQHLGAAGTPRANGFL